jgi:hypothetical protein
LWVRDWLRLRTRRVPDDPVAQRAIPEGYVDIDRGRWRVVATRLELAEMLLESARADTLAGEGAASAPLAARRQGGVRAPLPVRAGSCAFSCATSSSCDFRVRCASSRRRRRRGRPAFVPFVHAVAVEEKGPFYRGWVVTSVIDGERDFIDVYAEEGETGRQKLLGADARSASFTMPVSSKWTSPARTARCERRIETRGA